VIKIAKEFKKKVEFSVVMYENIIHSTAVSGSVHN